MSNQLMKMTFRSRLFYCYLFVCLQCFQSNLWAQNSDSHKLTNEFKELLYEMKHERVLELTKKYLQSLKVTDSQDSLFFAKLKFFEHNALQHTTKNYDILTSLKSLIHLCPQTQSGDSLKGVLYNKKAYYEAENISTMASFKSVSASVKLLEGLSEPSVGYSMGAYL